MVNCVFTVLACRTNRFIDGRRLELFAPKGIRSGSSSAPFFISMLPNVCNSKLSMFSYEASCDCWGLVQMKILQLLNVLWVQTQQSIWFYLMGMHRKQSSNSQSLPNSSPSSRVCGKRWCNVSGKRNPVIPPNIDMNPITTNGSRKFSFPYMNFYFFKLVFFLLTMCEPKTYQIIYERYHN